MSEGLRPRSLAVRSDGTVYIADTLSHKVWAISGATRGFALAAGTGVARFSGDGGAATSAKLYGPWAVAVDELRGRLLIADTTNMRVRAVVFATGRIHTVVGNGVEASRGDGGAATSASINAPRGVVAAADGSLYIAEGLGHVLRRVSPGGVISTIAGTGARGFRAGANPATSSPFSAPGQLALSDDGATVVIADTDNFAVRALTLSTGILTTVAGNGSKAWTPDGMPATAGGLTRLLGVAIDGDGVIYFSDSGYGQLDFNGGNNCVRAVDPSGRLRTVAGRCNAPSPHIWIEGVQALATVLDEPCGIALEPDSRRLHIADYGHQAIRWVTLAAAPTSSPTPSRSAAATKSRTRTRKAKLVRLRG